MVTLHPPRGAGLTELITTLRCLAQLHAPEAAAQIRTAHGGVAVPDELALVYLSQHLGPGPAPQPQPATAGLSGLSRRRESAAGLTPRKRTTTTEERP